jgi:Ca-activated chloride channel homolog
VLGTVAALVVVTVVAVRAVAADAGGCGSAIRLTVDAAPDIAPTLRDAAARWVSVVSPKVNGECVRVQVTSTPPAELAARMAARAGTQINVAAQPAGVLPDAAQSTRGVPDAELPAVWVPDSVQWVGRVQALTRDAFDDTAPSIAMSPVVLAMPDLLARATQASPHPVTVTEVAGLLQRAAKGDRTIQVGVAEPRRDSAGLAGAVLLHDAIVTSTAQLPMLVGAYRAVTLSADTAGVLQAFAKGQTIAAVSEQAVAAYDAANPVGGLTAVALREPSALDYPYAVLSGKPRSIARAAEMFRSALLAPQYRDIFARAGFREPDGSTVAGFPAGHGVGAGTVVANPMGDAAKIGEVVSIWTASRTPSRVLTLADVTASMGQRVPLPGGQVTTRMQVLQKASIDGLRLFANDSELGLWAYAAGLAAAKDYRELVPIAPLTAGQRGRLDAAVAAAAPVPTNVCGLYDTLLAAYKVMKDGYHEGMSNTIVVFTDGGNTKPGALSIDALQLELEKLTDITRPIRVILLGIGPDINIDELNAIATTTGGRAFKVEKPEQIGLIFLEALLRAG